MSKCHIPNSISGLLLSHLAVLVCVFTAGAAERLPLKPFLYYEGFEDGNPVQLFQGRGKCTVNFQGVTEEKGRALKFRWRLVMVMRLNVKLFDGHRDKAGHLLGEVS